jgi:hypothetical protein
VVQRAGLGFTEDGGTCNAPLEHGGPAHITEQPHKSLMQQCRPIHLCPVHLCSIFVAARITVTPPLQHRRRVLLTSGRLCAL